MLKIKSDKISRWLEFILVMTTKEIKARYKHAFFGFLWAFLNPVFQMLTMGFIFHFFVPVKVDNYFIFLFSGLLPWNFFSQTLSKCIPSVVYERALIQKSNFPKESIVLSVIFSNLFHFVISSFLFISYLIIFDSSVLTPISFLLFPFGIILLLLTTTGLSLLFSALNVKYRDVNFFVQAILPLLFYATPILYTVQLLPEPFRYLLFFNPMTTVLDIFHMSIGLEQTVPINFFIANIVVSILVFIIGLRVFKKSSIYFDDWI